MALGLKGRKGSTTTSRKATRHDDTLFATDTVELLLAISEGPIDGFVDGAASFYVGDVPLLDKGSNTPNISNFELRMLRGTNPADSIRLNLGGLSSSKNVGLELRTAGQAIVTQGDKTQIDYIDIRIVVQQLLSLSAEGGEFPTGVEFKIEIKPRSASTWQIPFDNQPPPPVENTSGASNYRPGASTPGTVINDSYRETYVSPGTATQPVPKATGAMWFLSDLTPWSPRIWNGTSWQVPNGLASGSRSGYAIWTWTDYDGASRTAWYSPSGTAPPPGTLGVGDFLLTPQSGEQVYAFNDTSWVSTKQFDTPAIAAPGVIQIAGLTRSPYPKDYRIPVARINEPYDVRLTRISPVSDKTVVRNITFESIQEVKRDVVSFPDLALAWLTIKATDTFTQVPDFTGVYRGIRVPVPSNHVFNETTNLSEFPGIWDGTFKIAYTNNPSWHAYNFIKNSRYGKNAYYPEVPDQWDFYEFGKHCSAHGFRFNEYIQDPRSTNELINYIVGIAGGRYVDRGDGYSTVIWDADDQVAQAIFAPENTVEGSFSYSFTDAAERKNDFKVSFKNPGLNYREDRVRVYDQNTIDVNGRNAEEFVAVGCRDPEEAVKRGRLRLATSLTEKIIVSFKTNRMGRYLLPFQVILIADDQSTNVISGRVKNSAALPTGTSVLPLRDQIYLEAGVSYSIQFTLSNGNGGLKVVTYPLTVATPGLQSQLQLSQALSEPLPEYAVFSIGAPKPFRIVSITQDKDEPDQIEITAIEVNRLKWAFVDGTVELRDLVALQTGPLSRYVYPVTGAQIVPEITADGRYNLLATWNPTETKLNRGYRVYQSFNQGPMSLVAEPSDTLYRIESPAAGTYILSIVAVGLDNVTESPPVTVSYVVASTTSIRSVAPPKNLRLVNEPAAPLFYAINPQFTWEAAEDPLVIKYIVEVLNGAGAVLYTERVEGQLVFSYTLAQNKASNGGVALRAFTVRVRSIDMTGSFSEPVTLAVNKPAPPAVVPDLQPAGLSVVVSYERPALTTDIAGALVWMEQASGYDPLQKVPAYDGELNPVFIKGEKGKTYYVRVALYDSYGKSGLNISAEKSISIGTDLIDTVAPIIPDAPSLSTTLDKSVDGKVSASVTATWAASPSTNFGRFEVRFRETATGNWGPAENVGAGLAITKRNLLPGTVYQAQLRAVNQDGFAASGWSATAEITSAANTAPPGAITGLVAVGGFERAYLSWSNPTDNDLSYLEVYAGTSNVFANATRIATLSPRDTTYQDPLSTTGTKFYWVRPFNSSKVGSTSITGPVSATSVALVGAQIGAGIIDQTKVASSLALVETVSVLPTTGNFVGRQAYLTADSKLYRFSTLGWTREVDGADLRANSILAGAIAAGAVKAAQLDAGAVTASKLAIQSANQFFNGDLAQGMRGFAVAYKTITIPTGVQVGPSVWGPDGLPKQLQLYATGTPSSGQVMDADCYRIDGNGNNTFYSVTGGQTYEFSAAVSAHRSSALCYISWLDASQNFISQPASATVYNNQSTGGPISTFQRVGLIAVAPSNAVYAKPSFRLIADGTVNPIVFVSAIMWAGARTGQTELSPYVDPTVTAIDGANLFTGSLNANRIIAGSMTTDRFTAGTIDAAIIVAGSIKVGMLDASVLTAANITVSGATRLSSWLGGTDTTKINGGAIEANSIRTNSIQIGARGISVVGIEFQMGRDGNGNLTNTIQWTAGYVLYINDSGVVASAQISAGSVPTGGGFYYIFWQKGAGVFIAADTNSYPSYLSNPDLVLMASTGSATGLAVFYGGTVIDGTKITTLSITAAQIAANQIQTQHMQANSIQGDRIAAGSLVAEKIASGTITAAIVYIGNDRMYLQNSNGPRLMVYDTNGVNRVAMGELSGNGSNVYGAIFRNAQNQIVMDTTGLGGAGIGVPGTGLLASGGSANVLDNATFDLGTAGWLNYSNTTIAGYGIDLSASYALSNGHTYWLGGANGDNGAVYIVYANRADGRIYYPATPNQRWEASAWLNPHRCSARVVIAFMDGNGNALTTVASSNVVNNDSNGSDLTGYKRVGCFALAPGGTVFVRIQIEAYANGQGSPYLFFTQPHLGVALPNQAELSPWSPGGGQMAKLNSGNIGVYMAAATIGDAQVGTLSANKISVNQLSAFTVDLGEATAGRARSGDSKFVIDFNARYLAIWD